MDLRVLLRCWRLFSDDSVLQAVHLSCDRMAAGGIYDHLGGGFHRYSTDARWLVPHFEKMLYDNGLRLSVYSELFQISRNGEYNRVVSETLDYVRREMAQPDGGFCSAQDADSEGEEGRFFVWTYEEIVQVLGVGEADMFCSAYEVIPTGNWEGFSILNRPRPFAAVADDHGLSQQELVNALMPMKDRLFSRRQQRIVPDTDDKVITAWNGMMISGVALAARVTGDESAARMAGRAADYIFTQMRTSDGRLLHSVRENRGSIVGFLDDYVDVLNVVSAHRESRIPYPAFFGIDGDGDLHRGFMYFEGWLLSIGRWDSLTAG